MNLLPNDRIEVQVRPSRDRRPPIWASDYVCNLMTHKSGMSSNTQSQKSTCQYPIENYMTYKNISPTHLHYLCNIDTAHEPYTYKEAIKDEHWIKAMKCEIDALESNHTWDIVPLPKDKKPVRCKCVYKIKYKPNGEVDKYKAKLVAKSYNQ